MPAPIRPERLARAIHQLREDVLNARECEDDTIEVLTDAVETLLAVFDRLTAELAKTHADREQFHAYDDWGVRYGVTSLGDEEDREYITDRDDEECARRWRDQYAAHGVIVTRMVLVGPWRDADATEPTAAGDPA